MKYFKVRVYKFNDDVIYLNKKDNKLGTLNNPFKYYFEPINEYSDTFGRDIIISLDKRDNAKEIITDIEIPIIFKDEVISYNYDNFSYVKTFNNVIPPKGDIHTFSVIERTIYNDFGKTIIHVEKPTYEEIKKYIEINSKIYSNYKEELESIFINNQRCVDKYRAIINEGEKEKCKIKKLISDFKMRRV